MAVSCPNSIRLPTDNLQHHLNASGINIHVSNGSVPWAGETMFLTPTAQQLGFVFGSIIGNSDDSGLVQGSPNVDIFNCTITSPRVEANITCNGTSCKASRLRRSEIDHTSPLVPPLDNVSFLNLLTFIPQSLGHPHPGYSSTLDNYILGSDAPFSLGFNIYSPGGYAAIPGSFVSRRLTTLFNTAWQLSLCPYGISTVNLTACTTDPAHPRAGTTTATAMTITPQAIYIANAWHAIALLLITSLLQLAGLASMVLSAVTRAPNLLGFVSSLTRDSPYVARMVPRGGSMLDGGERARLLGDMRVRLVDTQPEEPVGRIAFVGMEEEEGRGREEKEDIGRLDKRRRYE